MEALAKVVTNASGNERIEMNNDAGKITYRLIRPTKPEAPIMLSATDVLAYFVLTDRARV